jgi:hypothetical protein
LGHAQAGAAVSGDVQTKSWKVIKNAPSPGMLWLSDWSFRVYPTWE